MNKFTVLLAIALGCFTFAVPGCGSGETEVIEAPEVVEEDPAMEGMSEEEYDAAMEASMNAE